MSCTIIPKSSEILNTEPSKKMGGDGCACAKMFINKMDGGRQTMRICIDAGFDWRKSVKPHLPNTPDWCPASHFGYLESGEMDIQMENGDKVTIKEGETYFVPPGHLPEFKRDTVMVEFSQDTTFTNEKFLKSEGAK